MKDTTSTARVAGYLTKIFRAINTRYFDGQIEESRARPGHTAMSPSARFGT